MLRMGDPHPILQGPLIAIAQEADRPPGPWHLGGPTPELSPAAMVRTATACAEWVSEHVRASGRAAVDGLISLLRPPRRGAPPDPPAPPPPRPPWGRRAPEKSATRRGRRPGGEVRGPGRRRLAKPPPPPLSGGKPGAAR